MPRITNLMTNEAKSEPTQEIDFFQSAPARAWTDTIRSLSTASFWLMELAVTLVVGLVVWVLSVPQLMAIVFTAAAPATTLLLSGLFLLLTAPLKQRNEARKKLAEVREQLRPKLRIVNTLKSYELEGERVQDYVYIEFLRLLVSNESDSPAINCKVSLLSVKPKIEYLPTIMGNTRYSGPNLFDGYPEAPYPVLLTWSDYASDGPQISRDISARGQAQVSAFRFESGKGLFIAFATEQQSRQFRLPETEVVFSLRVDSDNAVPRFYVLRYRPNVTASVEPDPSEILQCGDTTFDLEQFREKVQTPAEWFDDEQHHTDLTQAIDSQNQREGP